MTPWASTDEAYVMGEEDGVEKSPEWAEPICGVKARVIKALADESGGTSARRSSSATMATVIRGPYRHEPARLQGICLAMQGLGKPGQNQAKMIEVGPVGERDRFADQPLRAVPAQGLQAGGHPDKSNHPSFLPKRHVPKAILEGECDWWGCESETADRVNQFEHYKYRAVAVRRIHMVWTDSPSWITCWNAGNDYVKAMRHPDIEFMFAQHPWLENDCLMADIILPVNTKLEEDDIAGDIFDEHAATCCSPSRSASSRSVRATATDYEIAVMLSERLGLKEEYTGGKTIAELVERGYETSRCEDLISWEELNEKGYYAVPTDNGWERCRPASTTSTKTRRSTRSAPRPAS